MKLSEFVKKTCEDANKVGEAAFHGKICTETLLQSELAEVKAERDRLKEKRRIVYQVCNRNFSTLYSNKKDALDMIARSSATDGLELVERTVYESDGE